MIVDGTYALHAKLRSLLDIRVAVVNISSPFVFGVFRDFFIVLSFGFRFIYMTYICELLRMHIVYL